MLLLLLVRTGSHYFHWKEKTKNIIAIFNKKLAALTIKSLGQDGDDVRRFLRIKINMERRNEKGKFSVIKSALRTSF